MSTVRGSLKNFYEDLTPYVVETIGKFKEMPTKYSEFLNIKSTDAGWVDVNTKSGLSLWGLKGELEDAQKDAILEGPTARAQVLTYAQRTEVSSEAIEDDKGGAQVAQMLPEILKSGRATQEVIGHDILNSAFGDVVTPDGLSLINAAHTNIGGGTQSNLLTGDLTQAKLEEAVTAIENMTDDRGIPIMQTARTLVVHPDNMYNAKVILGTPNAVGQSGGHQLNDINPMSSSGIRLVSSPYLIDTDAWFLLSDDHKLNWYWRRQVQNWSEVDYVAGAVQIGASFRCVATPHDWRGIVGSAGA